MPIPTGKVECPDCGITVQGKNLQKHYRKAHPGLDPYRRVKDARKRRLRKPHIELSPSRILGIVATVLVVAMLVIASLITYSFFFEKAEAEGDQRDVFFAADDGIVINATFYSPTVSGASTIYLVHDIGSDRSVWDEYAEYLQDHGYNVLAMDMRGHGGSVNSIRTDEKLLWQDMEHEDFLLFMADITAAYRWVQGEDAEGNPNTDAGPEGAMVGIGKGGLYGLNKVARMSRERLMSSVILSPTLDCYSLDVIQVTEDYGDIRPLLLAASEGDGTGKKAVDTIMELKEGQEEYNGHGVFVPGSEKGIDLLSNEELKDYMMEIFQMGWDL
ncbi:MAG: alpha/beta hydrolase [Thermoplasmatota archaeon]